MDWIIALDSVADDHVDIRSVRILNQLLAQGVEQRVLMAQHFFVNFPIAELTKNRSDLPLPACAGLEGF